jgi:hypothetical protein
MKHTFYSKDDGLPHTDLIRCCPKAWGRIRFDTVLVQTRNGFQPARLHLLFEVEAFGALWQLARVTYFTEIHPSALDRAIGMRLYEEEVFGEFIVLGSVIRSCYMSPVAESPRRFYLNDLIAGDVDLFLRIQEFN